jgi:hypothetical protein
MIILMPQEAELPLTRRRNELELLQRVTALEVPRSADAGLGHFSYPSMDTHRASTKTARAGCSAAPVGPISALRSFRASGDSDAACS